MNKFYDIGKNQNTRNTELCMGALTPLDTHKQLYKTLKM